MISRPKTVKAMVRPHVLTGFAGAKAGDPSMMGDTDPNSRGRADEVW